MTTPALLLMSGHCMINRHSQLRPGPSGIANLALLPRAELVKHGVALQQLLPQPLAAVRHVLIRHHAAVAADVLAVACGRERMQRMRVQLCSYKSSVESTSSACVQCS